MKRSVKVVLITLLVIIFCADWYDGNGRLVYRGLLTRLAEAIHEAHGGERHPGDVEERTAHEAESGEGGSNGTR